MKKYAFIFLLPVLGTFSILPAFGPLETTEEIKKIALINPTFTGAAYDDSFYIFFRNYNDNVKTGQNVTSDLHLLTSRVTNQSTQDSIVYILSNHLTTTFKESVNVTILTDLDVHHGLVFQDNISNQVNAYDALILFHNEYVTQQEYDNLKTFVANGGTIFFMDGNALFAEVNYDESTQSITLVKGHWWEFDGQVASPSVAERWANETTEWVGSNYFTKLLCNFCQITFDTPFNYQHHEEQYITNPNVKIILNYNATTTSGVQSGFTPVVATYYLDYKQGQVVVLGLYTSNIINNATFLNFFNNLVTAFILKDSAYRG